MQKLQPSVATSPAKAALSGARPRAGVPAAQLEDRVASTGKPRLPDLPKATPAKKDH